MPETALLELRDLRAGYTPDTAIVDGVSLTLSPGTVTTVVGGNGAGKSTLMKAIYGTVRHLGGEVRLRGEPIQHLPPWERLSRGIGLVPQGRCNFPEMSVEENLRLGAYRLTRSEAVRAIERVAAMFPVLRARWKTQAANLSGGEQQLLETAMVLETAPSLLLLDEPSLGLSPKMQAEIFATAASIARDTGLTVLMVEQNVRGALRVSDTAIVLEQGRKLMEGPAAEVARDPRIRQAYLGGGATAMGT
ncbi:ABC transporter ATP-binding protein [Falsiroseomonas oryzae]|uniref:ABC transporter ATP-binding protein n=1 Tax=Falsiroseomonas oryzae TaxID=2766473 RepID=UPI0022EB5AA4|nr:ABC transporter ATP-binding protein [Roseomonas sp. MO-31]